MNRSHLTALFISVICALFLIFFPHSLRLHQLLPNTCNWRKYAYRIYRRKYLGVMVACTWLGAFCSLIPTWRGKWGQFGLDRKTGSCSILPGADGKYSAKFAILPLSALSIFFVFFYLYFCCCCHRRR